MQRSTTLILVLCVIAAGQTPLAAATKWCVANHADAVFCEDWDRFCTEPPTDPSEACPVGAQRMGLLPNYSYPSQPWYPNSTGCTGTGPEDYWITTAPFSGRVACQGDLGINKAPLVPFIRSKFGQASNQIIATDALPLILEFVLDSPPMDSKMRGTDAYMELASQTSPTEHPLTDYIYSMDCTAVSCGGTLERFYPMICRQTPVPVGAVGTCPPIETVPVLPSIAVGVLAYLDPNPCHCNESDDRFSHAHHLAFFDGKQWWTLRQELFAGSSPTFIGSGDFGLHARKTMNTTWTEPGPMHVRLTLTSTIAKVELTYVTTNNPEAEYSWCEIPRQYVGPFNYLNMGFAQPCRLKNNGSGECGTIRQCIIGGHAGGATNSFDNIALTGGMGFGDSGACCIVRPNDTPPSINCAQADGEIDCDITYGGQYMGAGTNCATTPCCPPFLPDHDMDGDVDLEDFGWFQTCLSSASFENPPTVPCKCANLDGNTGDIDVDAADFVIFANCLSGPGITADHGCFN